MHKPHLKRGKNWILICVNYFCVYCWLVLNFLYYCNNQNTIHQKQSRFFNFWIIKASKTLENRKQNCIYTIFKYIKFINRKLSGTSIHFMWIFNYHSKTFLGYNPQHYWQNIFMCFWFIFKCLCKIFGQASAMFSRYK